jgi:hypothetical protein
LPHCWHSSFSSEADIVTTAGTQATVQGRNRYCHIAGTQASGQKADIVTTAGTQSIVQGRNGYCHIAGTQASGQKQRLSQLLALKQQFKADTDIATFLALKLQVRSRYCHNCCLLALKQ